MKTAAFVPLFSKFLKECGYGFVRVFLIAAMQLGFYFLVYKFKKRKSKLNEKYSRPHLSHYCHSFIVNIQETFFLDFTLRRKRWIINGLYDMKYWNCRATVIYKLIAYILIKLYKVWYWDYETTNRLLLSSFIVNKYV